MSKSIKELTAEIDVIVSKLQTDFQISSPSKLFGNTLLPNMATGLMRFSAVTKSFPGLTSMVNKSIRQNQLLEEIAHTTGKTTDEIAEFCKTHLYSLEFIKNILMMGAELNEESINRTLAQTSWIPLGDNMSYTDMITLPIDEPYTFLVTFPSNDRREVKVAYMEVDNGFLYFKDKNQETILVFAPGHWVWAERVEDNENH